MIKKINKNLISIFVPTLHGGGAERVTLLLARGFMEKGYDVDIVLVEHAGIYLDQVPENVNLVDLNRKHVLTSLPRLIRYLRKKRPFVMLSIMDHSNVIALLARRLSGVQSRIVISSHIAPSVSMKYSNFRSKMVYYIARWCYDWADDIITVSQGVADDLSSVVNISRSNIRTIYNPIITPEISMLAMEKVNCLWLNAFEMPVLITAGRLNVQKDYPTLLQAFSLVVNKIPAKLIILGEGEDRDLLEKMIQELALDDCVCMPGFVKNPYSYISKGSIFILSSLYEGFGNVLVESMGVGTPVISTDCPSGPAEILDNGKYGRLVPVGDAEALARSILLTLESAIDSNILLKRADDFSYIKVSDQYLDVLYPKNINL
jgi:glycosyltransferase involved in cell wall biosynthesis